MLKNRIIFLGIICLSLWTQALFAAVFWDETRVKTIENAVETLKNTNADLIGKVDRQNDEIATLKAANESKKPTPGKQPQNKPGKKTEIKVSKDPQKKTNKCELVGTDAISDWLNSINIGSFYAVGGQFIRNHSDCFVFSDSTNDISVWLDLYGFNADYKSSLEQHQKIDLHMTSTGAGIGGQFLVSDEINVGGGIGYFHSNADQSDINGVYFGPAVQYLFSDGWVGLTVFGMGNFYDGKRKVCLPQETKESVSYTAQSWDVDVRIETEYMLEPPSDFFITDLTFHPFLRIDYFNVFELSHDDKIDDQMTVLNEGRHSSYFYSKLGTRFERVMICNQSGNLNLNIDLGWINMSPISGEPVRWKLKGTEKGRSFDSQPESKNQLAVGAGIIGMYTNGLLIGLEYAGAFGADSPMQTGRMRFEWNW